MVEESMSLDGSISTNVNHWGLKLLLKVNLFISNDFRRANLLPNENIIECLSGELLISQGNQVDLETRSTKNFALSQY